MKTEEIVVANLKCEGCATTIKNTLLKIKGVHSVEVDMEGNAVSVGYDDVERKVIVEKLYSLGYPEATEKNGLLLQLKSYTSCMIGKVHNL
jgi:copper chaperone CopZ